MSTPPPPAPPPSGPWQPPQQQSGPGGFGAAPQDNGKATAALVVGILGVVCVPLIASIVAIVLGVQAKNEIDRSNGAQTGRGKAVAGIVLGWLGIAWVVLWVLAIFAFGLFASSMEDDLQRWEQEQYETGSIAPLVVRAGLGAARTAALGV